MRILRAITLVLCFVLSPAGASQSAEFEDCAIARTLFKKCPIILGGWAPQCSVTETQRTQIVTACHLLAEIGDPRAQAYYDIGIEFFFGETPRSKSKRLEKLPVVPPYGSAKAALAIAWAYKRGEGIPRSYAESLKWCRTAAENGNAEAQHELGLMYALGQGVPRDYAEAVRWFQRSAVQNNGLGQMSLADMYRNGTGVTQDYVSALMWYNVAAARGEKSAAWNGASLTTSMTPEQIVQARQMAFDWLHAHPVVRNDPLQWLFE